MHFKRGLPENECLASIFDGNFGEVAHRLLGLVHIPSRRLYTLCKRSSPVFCITVSFQFKAEPQACIFLHISMSDVGWILPGPNPDEAG